MPGNRRQFKEINASDGQLFLNRNRELTVPYQGIEFLIIEDVTTPFTCRGFASDTGAPSRSGPTSVAYPARTYQFPDCRQSTQESAVALQRFGRYTASGMNIRKRQANLPKSIP